MTSRLKKQRIPILKDAPKSWDANESYEQGYQPQQQPPETYQEGGRHYPYPQAQSQETEQVPHRVQ